MVFCGAKAQAETLSTASSGLKLDRLEIEPLALHTLYHSQLSGSQVKGVLNIGSTRSYLAIFQKDTLVFVRSIGFGCAAFYQYMQDSGAGNVGLEKLNCLESGLEGLMRELVSELGRSLEYFRLQSNHEELSQIILCGGVPGWAVSKSILAGRLEFRQMGDFSSQVRLAIPFPPRKRRSLSMSISSRISYAG